MSLPRPRPWARACLVTCEHASNRVPPWAAALWAQHLSVAERRACERARRSHRGYDPGAAAIARGLAAALGRPPLLGRATRLLVDLNRSERHPARLSEWSRALPPEARERLVRQLWRPHWQRVARALLAIDGPAVHVAVHSFDSTLAPGRERIDVGLLYDPSRGRERRLASCLAAGLAAVAPELRVRRNAPYRGVADGLPTAIRRLREDWLYAGMEIEVAQHVVHDPRFAAIGRQIVAALGRGLERHAAAPFS